MKLISRHKKIFILMLIIIVVAITMRYVKKEIAIQESIEIYHSAENSEKNEEYDNAYRLYSLVIPDDVANYKKARDKINELDDRFERNKMAALGFTILKQEKLVDEYKSLDSVQVNVEESKMTCMVDGIGYMVFKGDAENNTYQQAIKASNSDYTIVKYEAKKEYGGLFSSDINMINQDTSLAIFKMSELSTSADLISDKLVIEYIQQYLNDGYVN